MAHASDEKLTGAIPAIQSQCTLRPKRGLTVALTTMDTATITTAHVSENLQVLGPDGFASVLVEPGLRLVAFAICGLNPSRCQGNI